MAKQTSPLPIRFSSRETTEAPACVLKRGRHGAGLRRILLAGAALLPGALVMATLAAQPADAFTVYNGTVTVSGGGTLNTGISGGLARWWLAKREPAAR